MVDARLPDGSRVNAIIPPLALDGPLLSIRRFGRPRSRSRICCAWARSRPRWWRCCAPWCARGSTSSSPAAPAREDDLSQLPVLVHPGPGAHRHHRGLRPSSSSSSPTCAGWRPARQHRGARRGHAARPGAQQPAHGAPTASIVGRGARAESLDMLQAMNTGSSAQRARPIRISSWRADHACRIATVSAIAAHISSAGGAGSGSSRSTARRAGGSWLQHVERFARAPRRR